MSKLLTILLALLVSVAAPLQAGWFDSEETKKKLEKKDEPDYMTLAALMIRDGHYDRAESILDSIDKSDPDFNHVKFHTLVGLVNLNQGEYQASIDAFLASIKASTAEVDPVLYVYVAQAYYGLQNFERTLWAFNGAGDYINTLPDLLGVKATCHWSVGQKPEAFAVLENADAWYPERSDFKIRRIFYLIELKLYMEAVDESKEFLERFGAKADSYLVVGEAMRRSQNYPDAMLFLEKGHLIYPYHEKILLSLAHTYMQGGHNIAAARLFEKASSMNPKYLEQSIGLYRMVNDNWRAKFLNAQVGSGKVKLKNWLEILLQEEKYEEILAIEDRLVRYGILKEDKMKYAMAYVHFISENLDEAEKYLEDIADAKVFKNALKLLDAIKVFRGQKAATL